MIDYGNVIAGVLNTLGLGSFADIEVVKEESHDLYVGDVVITVETCEVSGTSIVRHDRLVSLTGSNNHSALVDYISAVYKDASMEIVGKLLQPASEKPSEDSSEDEAVASDVADEEPTETE